MTGRSISESRTTFARLASLDVRLAHLKQEEAQLLLERSRLLCAEASAEQPVDVRTGVRGRKSPTPELPDVVTDIDQARAQRVLRNNEKKRRTAR